jgi:hypothetical protein
MAHSPPVGQALLIIEASRSHSHTTLDRTPLDEGSDRRRDLYATAHNTHNRKTSVQPAEFEPAIPTSEQPQTYALGRANTGLGSNNGYTYLKGNYVK